MTDQELKDAMVAYLLKSEKLPFEERPTSIILEEEFEQAGAARLKQCLEELEREGRIQGRELFGR
jgi:hypothetical protein